MFGEVLLLGQLKLFLTELGDKLESVLELAVALNLEQYGNSCVLLLCGHIRKVVLGVSQLFGAECDVNVQSTGLCVELSKRSSANVEGLEAPAGAALNALVGEQEILDNVVVILNAALRLCKTRQVAATVTGYELNLTAALLLEHFCIALCINHSVDVVQRHRTESAEGFFFLFLSLFSLGSGLCNNSFFSNRFFNNNLFDNFGSSLFNNFFNGFFNNFLSNFGSNLFVLYESDSVGCICGFVEVFSHSISNCLLNLVGYVCIFCSCINLVCQVKCLLLCHFFKCAVSVAKIDFGNLSVEFVHSLGNCLGSVNVSSLSLFSGNFLCERFCQSINTILDDCIGIVDLIGNNNRLNLGNVAFGFNGDNRISAALFKLDKLHTDNDRENDEQYESDENDESNADCGAPERNLVIGSEHKGDFACGSEAFNNIVGTVLAKSYGVRILCQRLGAFGCIVNVEGINRNALAVLACNEISGYGEVDAELFACCSTVNGESIALVCLQTANSLASKLGRNGQGCSYGIGNAVFTNDNDCAIGSGNDDVVTNNGHGSFQLVCVESDTCNGGHGSLYGVNTGLCNLSNLVAVCVVILVNDLREDLGGNELTVCTLNYQLITHTAVEQLAVIKNFGTVENNVVNLLLEGDLLGGVGSGYGVKTVGSRSNQLATVGAIIGNGNDHGDRAIAESLNTGEVITKCVAALEAFPSDAVDCDGSYGNVNLKGVNGVVSGILTGEHYVCVSNYVFKTVNNKGNLGLTKGNFLVVDHALEGNVRSVNSDVGVGAACRVVNNGCGSGAFPCQGKRLDGCGKRERLAAVVGNGDAGYVCNVRTVELGFFNRNRCVVDFNDNLAGVDRCLAIVGLYPTIGLTIELNTRIGSEGNGLCYVCCADREDHAASHNCEHCYESYESNNIALACKLNLLMFHNITTFP